jgi:OmpA family protein
MLRRSGMKTACISAFVLAIASPAMADRVPAGPDFLERTPPRGVDRHLALSDGKAPIAPLDVVGFAPRSAQLGATEVDQIDEAAAWLRAHPSYHIALEGHAEAANSRDREQDLAMQRASVIRERLIHKGIASDRIVVLVCGDHGSRVTMFASTEPVRTIAAKSIDRRNSQVAVWTDRGALIQEEPGAGHRPHEAIATRK